jgi:hypothetical protein
MAACGAAFMPAIYATYSVSIGAAIKSAFSKTIFATYVRTK